MHRILRREHDAYLPLGYKYLALRDLKNDFGLQPLGDVDFDDDSAAAVRKLTESVLMRPHPPQNDQTIDHLPVTPDKVVGAAILGTHSTGREAQCFRRFLL